MSSISQVARRLARALVMSLAVAGLSGCLVEYDPRPVGVPVKLAIKDIEVLSENPQAGHAIDLKVTVDAEEDVEDVSFVFVLRSAPDPEAIEADDEENIGPFRENDQVLDACVEDAIPATVLAEDGSTPEYHTFNARLIVPSVTKGGTYYIDASVRTLPTSNIEDSEAEDYDGENDGFYAPEGTSNDEGLREDSERVIRIGDELATTPDLVIGDVKTETDLIDIVIKEDPGVGESLRAGIQAALHDWVGTVEVTSFGGAAIEDVTISALIEVPGQALMTLDIWNTHEHVQVWRNDGSGQFKDTRQRLGSTPANAVALGDIDGDGQLDLVAGNGHPDHEGAAPNRVWINDGYGTFQQSAQEIGNAHTRALALGDVNGDGKLDLVTGNADGEDGESDKVYLNQEAGMLTEAQSLGSGDTHAVALADVDGDEDLDLITAGSESSVWINDGEGKFSKSAVELGNVLDERAVLAVGDVDGDGDPDIVIGGPTTPLVLWLNNGAGGFVEAPGRVDVDGATAIALGDLDRDTDIDLVVGLEAGGIAILRNDGAGTFARYNVQVDGGLAADTMGMHHAYALALGDVNADGLTDVVAGNHGPVDAEPDMVWINDGVVAGGESPRFRFRKGQELGGSDTRALVLGNIDRGPDPNADGDLEDGEEPEQAVEDPVLRDLDLDIVSGNLGLPSAIALDSPEDSEDEGEGDGADSDEDESSDESKTVETGTYQKTLVLSVLRPDSPTRIPIGLRIPDEVLTAIASAAGSSGFLSTKITFCLDPFDDIPEYETSFFDPVRPNDNCDTQEIALLVRMGTGTEEDNIVRSSSDRDESYGGSELGAQITIHADSRQDKNGSLQRIEKNAPFTARGFKADAYRVKTVGREVRDNAEMGRYDQSIEITGLTIYSSTKSGSQVSRFPTQNAAYTISKGTSEILSKLKISICAPPLEFAIEIDDEKVTETNKPDDEQNNQNGQANQNNEEQPKKKSRINGKRNSVSEIKKNGVVGFVNVGPFKLVITVGVCGSLSLEFGLNRTNDDTFSLTRWDVDDKFKKVESFMSFEAVAALTFFVEIALELDFGPITIAVGVRGEIDLLRGAYAVGQQAQQLEIEPPDTYSPQFEEKLADPASASELAWLTLDASEDGQQLGLVWARTQTIWQVSLTALGGRVSFFLRLTIEIDLGIAKFKKKWEWTKPLATWKGISIATAGGVFTTDTAAGKVIQVE